MATADPFMDELGIISYAPRPRACKDLYRIPRRNDFIEVLWCLDDLPGLPEKWCPAEVLHIYDGANLDVASSQSEQTKLANGILLYLPGETWDEQIDEVEFLEGHKLRCAANRPGLTEIESDEPITENSNPAIRWRYRESTSKPNDGDAEWTNNPTSTQERVKTHALIRAHRGSEENERMDVEVKAFRDGHASLTIELEKVKRELVGLT